MDKNDKLLINPAQATYSLPISFFPIFEQIQN
jgi:hypothetical protein